MYLLEKKEMRKIVKGKRQKFYCDICGKNIYDYIPKESETKFMGMDVPEFTMKSYCEYKRIRKKSAQADYCMECYEKLENQ